MTEARARRTESRGGVPDHRPGVFEHSRHSVWLLWHLNSVYACSIYLHQAWTNANDKMTVKDYIFYKTLCIRRKILNIITVQSVDPNKKVPDLNCGVQDLLLEVVDLK